MHHQDGRESGLERSEALVKIIFGGEPVPEEELSKLRECVAHVEYGVYKANPVPVRGSGSV